MSNCLWPHGLYIPWNSPGQNTGVVAFSFSRGSSKPRDRTHVSWIAGGLFTSWATREDQEYWSLWPIPSPADLFNPGIEPESPALQVDSLPTELLGKPRRQGRWPFYHLFKNFPQFVMIRIVKGFNTVDETEVDFFFLEFSCFLYDPVNVGNLISSSSSFSKPSLMSESSWFV